MYDPQPGKGTKHVSCGTHQSFCRFICNGFPVKVAWVAGHFGVVRNEVVDKLTTARLSIRLCEQGHVPLDFLEVWRKLEGDLSGPLLINQFTAIVGRTSNVSSGANSSLSRTSAHLSCCWA